jgi:hypothetical protein
MTARVFRDDDDGYLGWLAAHPDGHVLNITRSHSKSAARVHHAGCWTISGQSPRGCGWTSGQYVKVCAEHLVELEQWVIDREGEPISPCGTCHRSAHAARPKRTARPVATPVPEGRFEIHGPAAGRAVVEAWSDDYIQFPPRPVWQNRRVTAIKARCQQLEPLAGQLLHATFFGAKPGNADVENLALYNVDSFATSGRNGIRFEQGAATPPAPDGAEYPFCYRYALAPRSGTFDSWQHGKTLAWFDWTDLGASAGETKATYVWLSLARGEVEVVAPTCAPDTPFAVKVQVRQAHGRQRVWGGNLMKGIFDGVVSAFQAHTDIAILPIVVERIAIKLHADPEEIEELLVDQRRAVLGVVPQLVKPHHEAGIQWNPGDHWCVAGELLAAEPVDSRWRIKGELVELSRC